MTPHRTKNLVGDVAQLVERLNGIQEVEGSTPFVSTNYSLLPVGGQKPCFFCRFHYIVPPVETYMLSSDVL
jgi:hypothetical protein